jgi:hypothetical protein
MDGNHALRSTADWQSAVSPVANRQVGYLSRIKRFNQEATSTLDIGSPFGPVQPAVRPRTPFSSFPSVPKKLFLEKRTQTLPVIIDDLEKTNPKRTQIEAKRTQIKPLFDP